MEIRLAPGGSSSLALRSCSRCESRWWLRDGRITDFSSVLGEVRPARRSA